MTDLTADQVKSALYARHLASGGQMPGPWTVIEEWRGIDVLAFSAWQSQGKYARVGYEVKISRSDLRRELLKPHKRSRNVAWCNEFYFAVPRGLLTPEELAFEEPQWLREPGAFVRPRCEAGCERTWRKGLYGSYEPGTRENGWESSITPCEVCAGKGWTQKSRAELDAPTLWVPGDVGLVIVDGRGTRLHKRSPRRRDVPALNPGELGQLVRWVSLRPDPRHKHGTRWQTSEAAA